MPRQHLCGNFTGGAIAGLLAVPGFALTSITSPLAIWGRDNAVARTALIVLLIPAGLLFTLGAALVFGPSDGTLSIYAYVPLLPALVILAGLLLPSRG